MAQRLRSYRDTLGRYWRRRHISGLTRLARMVYLLTPPYPNAWWNTRLRKHEQRDTTGPSLVGMVFRREVASEHTFLAFDRLKCLSLTTSERGELCSGIFVGWNVKDGELATQVPGMHPMILELVRIRPDGSYTPWGDEHRLDDLFAYYSVDLEDA